jgi:ubiquinol-cytochrome c reductase cytochrome b subunit
LLGGLVQINPVWLYGPYHPASVTTDAQPDYYVGWLEGALRLAPPWLVHVGSYTIPEVFWPGVVLPGIVFGLLYLWPFLEQRVTHDRATHHLLDRPRNRPMRTAIGVAALTFFIVLTLAGGQDVIAQQLRMSVTSVTLALRILLIAAPIATAAITWKWCHDLQAADARAGGSEPTDTPGSEPGGPVAPAHHPAREAASTIAGMAVLAGLAALGRRQRTRRARVANRDS